MLRILTLLLAIFFAAGCATESNLNGGTSPELAPREFHGVPREVVYEQARKAIHELRWDIRGGSEASGVIQASTMMTAFSMGEEVQVSVTSPAPDTVKVYVRSMAHQGYDWGKNKANMREFYTELDRYMAEATRPQSSAAQAQRAN